MSTQTILVVALIVGCGALGTLLVWHIVMTANRRLSNIEKRLGAIEGAGAWKDHYKYNMLNGLMNVLALSLDADADLNAAKARQETIRLIINSLRSNPSEYDADKPSGK